MRISASLLLLAALASPTRAATLPVPQSFPTIGQALGAAAFGDTVLVSSGTYPELLTLVDGVILFGADSLDRPVIDGGGGGPILTGADCGATTRVQSFVLRNATVTGEGGAMRLHGSDVVIENVHFANNQATHGGAIGSEESDFTISNCTFTENTATQTGGAISTTGIASPTISGCRFQENDALAGGAISVRNASAPSVQTSAFASNQANQGGGMWFDLLTAGTVQGCTFASNEAMPSNGSAIFFNALNTATVTGCILAFGAGGGAVRVVVGATPTFGCNDVFGNSGGNSLAGGIDLGTNFSADPLFCNLLGGDFSLSPGSPCLPNGACGLVGAFDEGCVVVSVGSAIRTSTWSAMKVLYR
jgi:predicted outer membrane repeat protein